MSKTKDEIEKQKQKDLKVLLEEKEIEGEENELDDVAMGDVTREKEEEIEHRSQSGYERMNENIQGYDR